MSYPAAGIIVCFGWFVWICWLIVFRSLWFMDMPSISEQYKIGKAVWEEKVQRDAWLNSRAEQQMQELSSAVASAEEHRNTSS
jgi:hypothetical protein